MDPVTIATVTGYCFQVAKGSWEVGALLHGFIKEARVVNETVSGLANEVNQLGNVLDLVQDILKTLQSDLEKQPNIARSPHQSVLRSIKVLEGQVSGCESTVEALRAATKNLKDENGNFIAKAVTQFRVNMNKERVTEISRRISSHYHALNSCLTILNTQVIFILPQRLDADVKFNVDELREQEQALDSRERQRPLTGPESELLQLTRTTINDGETLYEQSVAGGSVFGGDLNSESSVVSWLGKMDLQFSEQDTDTAHLSPGKSQSPLQSTQATTPLSGPDDLEAGKPNLSSTSLNEPNNFVHDDPGVEIAYTVASRAMSAATEAFNAARYKIAKGHIAETLSMIKNLQSDLHTSFDLFRAHYILAVSSWYTEERATSKPKLIEFLQRRPTNDAQRLYVCAASLLLAKLYVEQGELEHARSSCENGLKARKILLGPESDEYADALALMSRIHTLLGNPTQSGAFASMIPAAKTREFSWKYARLAPRSEVSNFEALRYHLQPRVVIQKRSFGRKEHKYLTLSPINNALRSGQVQRAIELIKLADSQAIANEMKQDGFSPLHPAVVLGSMEAAALLLDLGASPCLVASSGSRIERFSGTNPLQLAIKDRKFDMVRLLARYEGRFAGSPWPLRDIAKRANDNVATETLDMLQCLFHVGCDINTRTNEYGSTLLLDVYHDVRGGRKEPKSLWMTMASEFLVSRGADVLVSYDYQIPLMLCLESENCTPELVEALLSVQPEAQVRSQDHKGRTPLHYALRSGGASEWPHVTFPKSERDMDQRLKVAAMLLRAGASTSAKDHKDCTPLDTHWPPTYYSDSWFSWYRDPSLLAKRLQELV